MAAASGPVPDAARPSTENLSPDSSRDKADVSGITLANQHSKRSLPLSRETRTLWVENLSLSPRTELDELICSNKINEALALLKSDPTISASCVAGEPTALHFAALFGDQESVRALVDTELDIYAIVPVFKPSGRDSICHSILRPLSFAIA